MIDSIIKLINDLVDSLYTIYFVDLFFSITEQLQFRLDIRDAYEYKKSKSRIKKERKQLSLSQKIFLWYPKDIITFAPFHLKLFQTFRIIHFGVIILISILLVLSNLFDLLKYIALGAILIKVPFYIFLFVYFFVLCETGGKGWDFSKSKRP